MENKEKEIASRQKAEDGNLTEQKKCQQCSKKFSPVQESQIYCSEKCRYKANSTIAKETRDKRKITNRHLDDNYKILEHCLEGNSSVIVDKDILWKSGFHFGFCTNVLRGDNAINYVLYDLSYSRLPDNRYLITKNLN